jgi:hypothetical protein
VGIFIVVENDSHKQRLEVQLQPGEGPAHESDLWTVARVPRWALGKPYHVQVVNRSNLHLSCEMTIDDHKVAWNAPIPPRATRYFGIHEWILQTALRQSLLQRNKDDATLSETSTTAHGMRYNGQRPDYQGQRVNEIYYPDPTSHG